MSIDAIIASSSARSAAVVAAGSRPIEREALAVDLDDVELVQLVVVPWTYRRSPSGTAYSQKPSAVAASTHRCRLSRWTSTRLAGYPSTVTAVRRTGPPSRAGSRGHRPARRCPRRSGLDERVVGAGVHEGAGDGPHGEERCSLGSLSLVVLENVAAHAEPQPSGTSIDRSPTGLEMRYVPWLRAPCCRTAAAGSARRSAPSLGPR